MNPIRPFSYVSSVLGALSVLVGLFFFAALLSDSEPVTSNEAYVYYGLVVTCFVVFAIAFFSFMVNMAVIKLSADEKKEVVGNWQSKAAENARKFERTLAFLKHIGVNKEQADAYVREAAEAVSRHAEGLGEKTRHNLLTGYSSEPSTELYRSDMTNLEAARNDFDARVKLMEKVGEMFKFEVDKNILDYLENEKTPRHTKTNFSPADGR